MSVELASARVTLGGTCFDACTEEQVVAAVRGALDRGVGGRIATPNVDILRQARGDLAVREHLGDADIVVADGAPLVWASRLAGTPLPERVTGSGLVWTLAAGLARDGRSVYLLGGEPAPAPAQPTREARAAHAAGLADARAALRSWSPATPPAVANDHDPQAAPRSGARRAAERLVAACPGLRIAGCHSPAHGFERRPAAFAAVCGEVVDSRPDLVYVGLGFPKQEWVISRLRRELPAAWFLGCGMAISFVAGDRPRAPRWMQRTGLEWAHRLASEPRRLAGRYLRHDAPYAMRLLASSCAARYRRPAG